MAAPVTSMRLTIDVLPLAEENSHGPYRDVALSTFKARKFALPVRLDDTIETVWAQIEERYKRNYLTPVQASSFTIKVLQDAYDCDLDVSDTIESIFAHETDLTKRLIRVVPSFVYRDFSVPFTSNLRPAHAQKRHMESQGDHSAKRQRLSSASHDVRDRNRPLQSTESGPSRESADINRRRDDSITSHVSRANSANSIVHIRDVHTGMQEFGRTPFKEESPELGSPSVDTSARPVSNVLQHRPQAAPKSGFKKPALPAARRPFSQSSPPSGQVASSTGKLVSPAVSTTIEHQATATPDVDTPMFQTSSPQASAAETRMSNGLNDDPISASPEPFAAKTAPSRAQKRKDIYEVSASPEPTPHSSGKPFRTYGRPTRPGLQSYHGQLDQQERMFTPRTKSMNTRDSVGARSSTSKHSNAHVFQREETDVIESTQDDLNEENGTEMSHVGAQSADARSIRSSAELATVTTPKPSSLKKPARRDYVMPKPRSLSASSKVSPAAAHTLPKAKGRRGRPRKDRSILDSSQMADTPTVPKMADTPTVPKRGRGRPRKIPLDNPDPPKKKPRAPRKSARLVAPPTVDEPRLNDTRNMSSPLFCGPVGTQETQSSNEAFVARGLASSPEAAASATAATFVEAQSPLADSQPLSRMQEHDTANDEQQNIASLEKTSPNPQATSQHGAQSQIRETEPVETNQISPTPEDTPTPEDMPIQEDLPTQKDMPTQEDLPTQDDMPTREHMSTQENMPIQEGTPNQEDIPIQEDMPTQEDNATGVDSAAKPAGTTVQTPPRNYKTSPMTRYLPLSGKRSQRKNSDKMISLLKVALPEESTPSRSVGSKKGLFESNKSKKLQKTASSTPRRPVSQTPVPLPENVRHLFESTPSQQSANQDIIQQQVQRWSTPREEEYNAVAGQNPNIISSDGSASGEAVNHLGDLEKELVAHAHTVQDSPSPDAGDRHVVESAHEHNFGDDNVAATEAEHSREISHAAKPTRAPSPLALGQNGPASGAETTPWSFSKLDDATEEKADNVDPDVEMHSPSPSRSQASVASVEHNTAEANPERSPGGVDSNRSSPAVARRPARFLSHSPTPQGASSDEQDDAASYVSASAGEADAEQPAQDSHSESDTDSDSDGGSSTSSGDADSNVTGDASSHDEEMEDAPSPAPDSQPEKSQVPLSQSSSLRLRYPLSHPLPRVSQVPLTKPATPSSQNGHAGSLSRNLSSQSTTTRRGFMTPKQQLAMARSVSVNARKTNSFDPKTQSLGALAKAKMGKTGKVLEASSGEESSEEESSTESEDEKKAVSARTGAGCSVA